MMNIFHRKKKQKIFIGNCHKAMKTAIIINTGFDGGGSTTLGYEFDKIGLDVFFRDITKIKNTKTSNIYKTYKSNEELVKLLATYEKVIFSLLAVSLNDTDKAFDVVLQVKRAYPHMKICYLNCARLEKLFQEVLRVSALHGFSFDRVYSIADNAKQYYDKVTPMLINAYTFREKLIECEKQPIVFSAGRVEAVKGTTQYFQNFSEEFKKDEYYYIHEGATFNFTKTNGISCPPQLLSLFETGISPKQPKESYRFCNYGELPMIDKLNIYSSYSKDDIDRWSTYYAGICTILGSVSKQSSSLFTNDIICANKTENNRLHKRRDIWGGSLEYANIEMIDMGIPVLLSRMYASIVGFTDEYLIYDCFSDIPRKVKELENHYDEVRLSQRAWLVNKQDRINKSIIERFEEDI